MKTKIIFPLILTSLVIVGCKKNNKPEEKKDSVTVNMEALINQDKAATGYDIEFNYSDDYFDKSANTFNGDIAMISYGSALAATYQESANAFFTTLGYDTIYVAPEYAGTPGEHTIGYSIAHKKINNSDMLAISIRGFEYKAEWNDNFMMGETGNHEGFDNQAQKILNALNGVLETHSEYENTKLWLTGYSRAGAVANVLSQKIITSDALSIAPENMYVYTFETPRGLTQENAVKYPNVFNVINSADLITYVAPEGYGLYRCGTDIDIYSNRVERLLYNFDKNATLPTFVISEGKYSTEQEYIKYIFTELLKEQSDPEKSLDTRERFVNNYQSKLGYLLGLFFTLDQSVVNQIMDAFNNMGPMDMLSLFAQDGIYNFIKPFLDDNHVTYDDAQLKVSCDCLRNVLNIARTSGIVGVNNNNIQRVVNMHYPEVNYVLLKSYAGK